MLSLSLLASLGMVFRSRNVYNRFVTRSKFSITSAGKRYDYLWRTRDQILKSWIGYVTLFVGMLNFLTSINYMREYAIYSKLLQENNFDETGCEVAGSWIVLSYCFFFQVALGSICVLMCTAALLAKGLPAIGIACPYYTSLCRKCIRGIPGNQFD